MAKSFARIHWQNLANFGILGLEFADPADYDALVQFGLDQSPIGEVLIDQRGVLIRARAESGVVETHTVNEIKNLLSS